MHLNTKKMTNWLLVSFLSIPSTLLYPAIQLLNGEGVYTFATWFSITSILFWATTYFGSILAYFPNKARNVILCLKQAAFIPFVASMGLCFDPLLRFAIDFHPSSVLLDLAVTAVFLAATMLVYFALFARSEITLIARYLRK